MRQNWSWRRRKKKSKKKKAKVDGTGTWAGTGADYHTPVNSDDSESASAPKKNAPPQSTREESVSLGTTRKVFQNRSLKWTTQEDNPMTKNNGETAGMADVGFQDALNH